MANWTKKLDLKKEWKQCKDQEISITELTIVISEKLSKLSYNIPYIEHIRKNLVNKFRILGEDPDTNIFNFDTCMEDLYSWADLDIDKFQGSKVCWIKTF